MTSKAVILIGGPSRGTRFRPLSFRLPKPLFPLAGEPLIYHHIAACAKVPGLKEVILVGFYEPTLFQAFIQETETRLKISVKYVREYKALGTAGGLYHFRDLVLAGEPECFFVLHADVVTDFHLADLLQTHKAHGSDGHATILGKKVPKEMTHDLGVIVVGDGNKVVHYAEKPETFVSDVISCGVYCFRPSIFDMLGEIYRRNHSGTDLDGRDQDTIRLEQDVLSPMASAGKLFVYVTESNWTQVKSAGSALPANALALDLMKKSDPAKLATSAAGGPAIQGTVFLHPTARIDATAMIGPNVSIGANAVIGAGVRIKESIILDDVTIKDHACILNSIIGWQSSVGEWTRIEGGDKSGREHMFGVRGTSENIVTIFGEDVKVCGEVIVRNCVVLPHKDLSSSSRNQIIM